MTQRTSPMAPAVTASLVELERELEGLLVEYEPASQAWPREAESDLTVRYHHAIAAEE